MLKKSGFRLAVPLSPRSIVPGKTMNLTDVISQYAALPFREKDGEVYVLLITSRETKRWILPKGQPEKKLPPHKVAALEAYEEAGVRGTVANKPFASYMTTKRLRSGREVPCCMQVYLCTVTKELKDWPEKSERERRWVTPAEAALLVTEDGLTAVLLDFAARWN